MIITWLTYAHQKLCLLGFVHPHINFTYISLIPKKASTRSFSDYRLISLYNITYKIISKTIATRIKHILSKYISPEQFGFLQNRQIHDVVAIAQECLHKIHVKKVNVAIMKVDLQNAYDYHNWGYLQMVLQKVGIQTKGDEWIMACVSNVKNVVVINGYPSHFFGAGRGLR